jgi:hypothetical protein
MQTVAGSLSKSRKNKMRASYVLEVLFNWIYAKAVTEFGEDAFSKMIEVSRKPLRYRRMPFGKLFYDT